MRMKNAIYFQPRRVAWNLKLSPEHCKHFGMNSFLVVLMLLHTTSTCSMMLTSPKMLMNLTGGGVTMTITGLMLLVGHGMMMMMDGIGVAGTNRGRLKSMLKNRPPKTTAMMLRYVKLSMFRMWQKVSRPKPNVAGQRPNVQLRL